MSEFVTTSSRDPVNRIARLLNLENSLDAGKLAKLPFIKTSRDPQLHTKRPHVASLTQGWRTLALEPWLCPNVAPFWNPLLLFTARASQNTTVDATRVELVAGPTETTRRAWGEEQTGEESSEHRPEKEFGKERVRERQRVDCGQGRVHVDA